MTPDTDVFLHSEDSGDVPQELNPSILILLIKHRSVSLKMLSIGLHLALLCSNVSVIRLQSTVSEELLAATAASGLLCLTAPEVMGSCLTILIPFSCINELF